jgi:hypothetical protein
MFLSPRYLLTVFIVISFFGSLNCYAEKKAQAAEPQVDIYSSADFDSEIIETIVPGQYYSISNKPKGPFYQIRLKSGKIGYVPDTELEIQGEGAFKEKPFADDVEERSTLKNKNKNQKKIDAEEDSDDPDTDKISLHGITIQLINYHEDTLGGTQVGDLYAMGYKYLPTLSEFSSSYAWDVAAAFKAPSYYQDLTGQSASGFALWSGFQILNISPISSNMTVHYGAGPFLKYTQFDVKSNVKNYSLQDLTVGVTVDIGLIFHFEILSVDLGLKYYWDKKSYGAMFVGILF